ncbi:MAG: hypothetical protein AB8B69_17000 [Chitinophagales bacterium]
MYKNVLRSITDIEFLPVVALVIFVMFFTGLLLWTFLQRKEHIDKMASLPLEEE